MLIDHAKYTMTAIDIEKITAEKTGENSRAAGIA